jgi:hypothetical protein
METIRRVETVEPFGLNDYDICLNMIKNSKVRLADTITLYDETKSHLVCNKWKCKDGTILNSRSRHDYVDHYDVNGEYYMLDGGLSYIRHSGNMECMCVYSTDSHEKIRDNFEWTSYGKTGRDLAKTNLLKNLDTDHIEAIIETQVHLSDHILDVFKNELIYRSK